MKVDFEEKEGWTLLLRKELALITTVTTTEEERYLIEHLGYLDYAIEDGGDYPLSVRNYLNGPVEIAQKNRATLAESKQNILGAFKLLKNALDEHEDDEPTSSYEL